jgi:3-deoxy-D-manno-octulosonate 8-phosphate phosphatase KdsC-like HAD superfamily phosphatase
MGCKNKPEAMRTIIETENGLQLSDVAYIGDSLHDLETLKMVGLSFCPANAVKEVKKACTSPLSSFGGDGAIWELSRKILKHHFKPSVVKTNN